MRPAWHAAPVDQILKRLSTGEEGLSSGEAHQRLAQHGRNVLPERQRRSAFAVVLGQLRSPLIYLLLGAAIVSLWLGEVDDAAFIFLVLFINTAIGAVQEWRAESNTAALRSAIKTAARVLRDGVLRRVDGAEIVPGDVLHLEAGERVPADLRLLKTVDLQANEASLTGESLPVDKAAGGLLPEDTALGDRITMLLAGTTVQRGRCEAVVVATGRITELGRLAQVLAEPAAEPPLIRRLDRFTRAIGVIALVIVAAIIFVRVLGGSPLQETFFLAVALAVSIIPEGLPVAVTVALSIATRRMARRHVIVRHLPAVEGLGACTVVATDKTGTLTLNRLTAKRLWLPNYGLVDIGGEGFALEGNFEQGGKPASDEARRGIRALSRSGTLCNDAAFQPSLGEAGASGDTVDLALQVLAAKAAIDPVHLRTSSPRVAEIPFSAERRFAASLNRQCNEHHLHVKGAPEVLIPLCRRLEHANALRAAEEMAEGGYRVLAVATRVSDERTVQEGKNLEDALTDLTLLGLVGFIDPLRPEARQAVAQCRRAGVAVKMVTGDHAATALAIARELGIGHSRDEVLTGAELARLAKGGPEAAAMSRAVVFARVEPAQKVQIVDALQAAGHVVAVTGDGVNDAPALHSADLGVAMGREGTDVAREAADLILTDDNFASVVAGIEEGRAAYANIRKVVYVLVSTGAAEVVMFMLAIATGLPVPLTAIQLLWLNLVTNGGQDVALAFEHREPGLLEKPPRPPDEPIFDRLMIRQSAVSGAYAGVVAYLFFAWTLKQGFSEFEARNLLLFLMVAFENVHVFNCRSEHVSALKVPLRNNWPLVGAVVGAQLVHVGAAFVPGIRDILEIEPISVGMWLLLLPIAGSLLVVMELEKALRRRGGVGAHP
ncbi:MAG: HAD-IC family P-type ATPase [Microvirga sp.]